jgi:hypothetical protein
VEILLSDSVDPIYAPGSTPGSLDRSGEWLLRLTITDDEGATNSIERTVVVSNTPNNDVPFYSQRDSSKWGGIIMHTCNLSIYNWGCALTSASMVFRYYGADTNPQRLDQDKGGGACPYQWNSVGGQGFAKYKYGGNFSYSQLEQALQDGDLALVGVCKISGCTQSDHWVVVVSGSGSSAANYRINDPWAKTQDLGKNRPLSELLKSYHHLHSIRVFGPSASKSTGLGLSSLASHPLEIPMNDFPATGAFEGVAAIADIDIVNSSMVLAMDITSTVGAITQMQISALPDFSDARWIAYEPRTTTVLTDIIYMRFADDANNISDVVSDTLLAPSANLAAASFWAIPAPIELTIQANQQNQVKTDIYSENSTDVTFTAVVSDPWISVQPSFGTIPSMGTASLGITLNATDLDPGIYTGTITIAQSSSAEVLLIPIYLTVDPGNQTLTVSKSGTGSGAVTSSPIGIDCGSTCSYAFAYNTSITLTAIPTSPATFGGWSGGGCSGTGTCIITMSAAQSVTAIFNLPINQTLKFYSSAANDGWLLESTEISGKGGALDLKSATLRLGDDNLKKQYRSILSFATGIKLPDTAVITKVTLKIKKSAVVGGATFAMFKGLLVDVKKGSFGLLSLQKTDFEAPLGTTGKTYGPFTTALPSTGLYTVNLPVTGATSVLPYINKLTNLGGVTQIRLRFKIDDNNNTIANYISFYSGNATTAANRPQLIIQYYVP